MVRIQNQNYLILFADINMLLYRKKMSYGVTPEKYHFYCKSAALPPSAGSIRSFSKLRPAYSPNVVNIEDIYGNMSRFTDKMCQGGFIPSSATRSDYYQIRSRLSATATNFVNHSNRRIGHVVEKWIRDAYLHISEGVSSTDSVNIILAEGVNDPNYNRLSDEDKNSLVRRAFCLAQRFYKVSGSGTQYPKPFDFGGDADLCNNSAIGEIKISSREQASSHSFYQAMLYAVRCALHSDFPIDSMIISTIHFEIGRVTSYVVYPWLHIEKCLETCDPMNNQLHWLDIGSGPQYEMIQRCKVSLACAGKGRFL